MSEKLTKKRLVAIYNTIAAEPVKTFKTVTVGEEAVQAVLDEYTAEDIGSIPEDIRTELADAGFNMTDQATPEEAEKPKRKRGEWLSHCHERVFQAITDAGNKPMTKEQIAELAITTVAVVANAFYDFKRGNHTPEGMKKVGVNKVREDGAVKYFLDLGETEENEDEAELAEALMS